MTRVQWHPQAIADVKAVISFGQSRWLAQSEALARHVIQVVAQLATFPTSGRVGAVQDTRELMLSPYPLTLVYEVYKESVVVLRVYHQRQKWPPSA